MKKFFKVLSGRPKSGDVVESIRPFIFFPQIIFCIVTLYLGFTSSNNVSKLLYSVIAIFIAWQSGWGMSLERFQKSEENILDKDKE